MWNQTGFGAKYATPVPNAPANVLSSSTSLCPLRSASQPNTRLLNA